MLSREQADEIVAYLAKQFGQPETMLGSRDYAELVADGVPITLFYLERQNGALLFHADLGELPEDAEMMMAALLAANHPSVSISGITLSLVPGQATVSVSGFISMDGADPPEAYRAVQTFLDVAKLWTYRLRMGDPTADPDAAPERDATARYVGDGPASGAPPEAWIKP